VDLDQLDVVTGETSINNIVNGALSGPPIDWRWATTMSVQTTFFSALEERQRPDKGGVAMIKGCTHIYAPKGHRRIRDAGRQSSRKRGETSAEWRQKGITSV
jgi:hypothetical protein